MATSPSRIARTCQFFATAVLCLSAVFTTGCQECEGGQSECAGDVARHCTSEDGNPIVRRHWWVEKRCAVKCHASVLGATCVDSLQPVPECAGASRTCFEGAPASCTGGYPVKEEPCKGEAQCVLSSTCGPICAAEPPSEPRCAQDSFCDGTDTLVTCKCGFVESRLTCSASTVCQDVRGEARCTQSTTPDPHCGDPTQRLSGFCDGSVATACWYGFVTNAFDCAPTSTSR